MKTFILTFLLLSTTAFASEKEGVDTCTSLRSRRDKIQREQSEVMREFVGREEEGSWPLPTEGGPFNCEDVPDSRHNVLKRYDALSRDIDQVQREIERYCPRSRPE